MELRGLHEIELSDGARAAYYAGALLLLSFLETRRATSRRFGPEAEARWRGFAGHLGAGDRLDILIRDADLEWPGAIGARRVFGLLGVADDDAFGPTWEGIAHPVAHELFSVHGGVTLASLAAWTDASFLAARRPRLVATTPPRIAPNDRFVVTGPSAVAALLAAFDGDRTLDFGAQVIVVAADPFARQLASAAPLVLATGSPARLSGAVGDSPADPTTWRGASLVVSSDASDLERALAEELANGESSSGARGH